MNFEDLIQQCVEAATPALAEAVADRVVEALIPELLRLPQGNPDDLLDSEHAAAMLGMTPGALRRAAERGTAPVVGRKIGRLWRWRRGDILAVTITHELKLKWAGVGKNPGRGRITLPIPPAGFAYVLMPKPNIDHLLAMPVGDIEWSVRTSLALERGGITTVGDLVSLTPEQLLRIKNFGRKCLREVEEELTRQGLSLRYHKDTP